MQKTLIVFFFFFFLRVRLFQYHCGVCPDRLKVDKAKYVISNENAITKEKVVQEDLKKIAEIPLPDSSNDWDDWDDPRVSFLYLLFINSVRFNKFWVLLPSALPWAQLVSAFYKLFWFLDL